MKLSLMLGILGLVSSVAFTQSERTAGEKPRTVTVRGMGSIATPPDQIRLSVQVSTRGESASSAMAEATSRTREILSILRSYGVEEKSIQTSRVTVTPILDYEKRIQPPPIVGYNGTNDFNVVFKGKLMEKVGEFMDKAVVAGAAQFSGLVYESSRQRELEREALRKAVLDAQARAEVLVRELSASLGAVLRISESSGGVSPLQRGVMMAEAAAPAPVMPGELTITALLDVEFEIK